MNNRLLIKTNRFLDALKIYAELFDGQELEDDEQYAFLSMIPGSEQISKMNEITTINKWCVDKNGFPMVELGQDIRVEKMLNKINKQHPKIEIITESQARERLPESIEDNNDNRN